MSNAVVINNSIWLRCLKLEVKCYYFDTTHVRHERYGRPRPTKQAISVRRIRAIVLGRMAAEWQCILLPTERPPSTPLVAASLVHLLTLRPPRPLFKPELMKDDGRGAMRLAAFSSWGRATPLSEKSSDILRGGEK